MYLTLYWESGTVLSTSHRQPRSILPTLWSALCCVHRTYVEAGAQGDEITWPSSLNWSGVEPGWRPASGPFHLRFNNGKLSWVGSWEESGPKVCAFSLLILKPTNFTCSISKCSSDPHLFRVYHIPQDRGWWTCFIHISASGCYHPCR